MPSRLSIKGIPVRVTINGKVNLLVITEVAKKYNFTKTEFYSASLK